MSGGVRKWRFAVDRGGTFTDVVAVDPHDHFHSLKLLSRSTSYKDASIEGIRKILGIAGDAPLPEDRIEGIRFGTTVATNALLERKGGKVVLLITKGFRDLLEIGYQNRPEIFKLCIRKPSRLYSSVIEVEERIDCSGSVIRAPDIQGLTDRISALVPSEIDSVAVVFMHSWKNPSHELLCETILKEAGFPNISLSHKAVNLIKIVGRGHSTLIDAYLSPALLHYQEEIRKATGDIPITFMQSNGALTPSETFSGKNALLSGPAGGVCATASVAGEAGYTKVIGFDMGGTSTDVSRFDGRFEKTFEKVIEGTPVQIEMLDINTVAAGGGSILGFDGQKMTAGPESAGSSPGPACYGLGGPLTVTDANLLVGRLIPAFFPSSFGPDGDASLDLSVAEENFGKLAEEINASLKTSFSAREIAGGFIKIADERMALAIKEISVSRGFDVREYALVCFGGAGGQHACSVADLLDIRTVVIHPLGSLMSAYGIGLSRPAYKAQKTVLVPYDRETHASIGGEFARMEQALAAEAGIARSDPDSAADGAGTYTLKKEMDLRPKGADAFLTLRYGSFEDTSDEFIREYQRRFGFSPKDSAAEVVNLRVELLGRSADFFSPYREDRRPAGEMPSPVSYQNIHYGSEPLGAPVYLRQTLPCSAEINGPAFIVDDNTTVVVDPDFTARIDASGAIIMTRLGDRKARVPDQSGKADPVLLEIFNSLFSGIAAEMGITLRDTAHSVNIKERLDFSCAVFDAGGNLVANAPHIPVHIGAMADTVKAVLYDNKASMKPGDIYLTNNPYRGGSHLPDMTVVCPVFSDKGGLLFFTASRGHHADIGGITPGSMPSVSSHIREEGVLIDNLLLVRGGVFREARLREILARHPFPARNPDENISNLRAQIASCRKGETELLRVIDRYGTLTVLEYMGHIQKNAAYAVKRALCRFLHPEGTGFHSTFKDHMDDGALIKVRVSIESGDQPPETVRILVDFTGTGEQHSGDNLNAPFSVSRSAVMYVLRTLIDADIPLNGGCLDPVELLIPEGSLLNPVYPAPVASGNVETSQRVVDVLLGAFDIAAASQGTMNNLLFEVEGEAPYYETIAGGAGATYGCHGASGVQVHMTNTQMTDPEVLEFRHPGIRLERFTMREKSGGSGTFRGGDGVIREIRFLRPAAVSILSERRIYEPYGIRGGGPGQRGRNLRRRSDGRVELLGHREVLRFDRDDSVIIETPGGGGYGRPD